MSFWRIVWIFLVSFIGATTAAASPDGREAGRNETFTRAADQFIGETLDVLGAIPGISVTVVRNGATIYSRGFGWADVEASKRMTPSTQIYIASNTKPFTALVAARLDEQGVIDLEESVGAYLPDTLFPSEIETSEITLRHLLTHTAGLVNDPLVFRTAHSGEHTPEELERLLQFTQLNEESPRGSFDYTNTGYNIAAMAMEKATGQSWQDLLDALIFEPLDMSATTARVSEIGSGSVPAAPYRATGAQKAIRIPQQKSDQTLHAAGGIVTTGADLGKWLQAQLGRSDAIPSDVIDRTHQLRVSVPGRFGPLGREGYALGWIAGSYAGERLVYHFGTFPGANSVVSTMPERDLGVAVFVNEDVVGARVALLITTFIYDWFVNDGGGTSTVIELRSNMQKMLAETRPPADPIEIDVDLGSKLAGVYQSPKYGTLSVSRTEEGFLEFRIGEMSGFAVSLDEGHLQVPLTLGRPEDFSFVSDGDDRITEIEYGDWDSFVRIDNDATARVGGNL